MFVAKFSGDIPWMGKGVKFFLPHPLRSQGLLPYHQMIAFAQTFSLAKINFALAKTKNPLDTCLDIRSYPEK